MESKYLTIILIAFAIVAKGWSMSVSSGSGNEDRKRSMLSADNHRYGVNDNRNNYDLLYSIEHIGLKDKKMAGHYEGSAHPFGSGISRSSAFHGKKSVANGRSADEENMIKNVNVRRSSDRMKRNSPISSNIFHGKKSIAYESDSDIDDQNTSVFHGKKSTENAMSEMLNSRYYDYFPSRSSVFHGKRDMREVLRYLLNGMDNRGEPLEDERNADKK